MDRLIFGSQYYRPPTPNRSDWDRDLGNMKALGLDSVRFWVLWRWVDRGPLGYHFDEIDELMDLAGKHGLSATLGIICDVTPKWFTDTHPDCFMVTAKGVVVTPTANASRQIGGAPGPCYSHEEALHVRKKFIEEVVRRYKDHPALDMWDVWCEPEQCFPYREPNAATTTCFCRNCKQRFSKWLEKKYTSVDKLNDVWGRCYTDFDDIELPVNDDVFSDFIDFCDFNLDKMRDEARMRISAVKAIDKKHPAYLHVVPNTAEIFNVITCVDDFAMAKECDLFASTNIAGPIWSVETMSAGHGKFCFNAECHIGGGITKMHPRVISFDNLLRDLVPQFGQGIRGIVFWQYRTESHGNEAPAWGMTKPDGTFGSIAEATEKMIGKIRPFTDRILASKPPVARIAILRQRKNEIFAFAHQNTMEPLAQTLKCYVDLLYRNNYECVFVDSEMLKEGLPSDIACLIVPYSYAMERSVADALVSFVNAGGTLLSEAHLGAYDLDRGRHSETNPGLGLADRFGIKEEYTTTPYQIEGAFSDPSVALTVDNADAKKALGAAGMKGGKYFAMDYFGKTLVGVERYAALTVRDGEVLARYGEDALLVKKKVGAGTVYYAGTNLAEGTADKSGLEALLRDVLANAGVAQTFADTPVGVHLDRLDDGMIVAVNTAEKEKRVTLDGVWQPVFRDGAAYEGVILLPPNFAEIYVRTDR